MLVFIAEHQSRLEHHQQKTERESKAVEEGVTKEQGDSEICHTAREQDRKCPEDRPGGVCFAALRWPG